jgi:DNA modification methylase
MLHFDETNPNQLTQQQMHGLRRSMERFGYLTPIIIDKDYNVADGEHRALIYKEFGLKQIPAYVIDLKDDTERRLLRQTMNKLRGQHEPAMDADEIATLYEGNKIADLATLIAQNQSDIMEQLQKYKPEIVVPQQSDEFDLEQALQETEQQPAITQVGDIWQLGQHYFICGDSTKPEHKTKLFEHGKPDIILTDPPYSSGGFQEAGKKTGSIGTRQHATIQHDNLSTRGYMNLMNAMLGETYADNLYLFTDWRMWCWNFDIAEKNGYVVRNMLVWDKMQRGMGFPWRGQHELILFGKRTPAQLLDGKRGNVLQAKRAGHVNHPTEKPVDLLKQILDNTEGSIVYDPFCGSGSTLMACEQNNMPFIGCEIDSHYCDVIVKRWESATGQKAVRVSDSK